MNKRNTFDAHRDDPFHATSLRFAIRSLPISVSNAHTPVPGTIATKMALALHFYSVM
jgi:hypothetical protein